MIDRIRRASLRETDTPQPQAVRARPAFAPEVLCHLRLAALLERFGYTPRETEHLAEDASSCEWLLEKLRRLGRVRATHG